MNENWNDLESRLASWTPRRPSPKLRARLFPNTAASAPHAAWPLRLRQNWWVPAAACLLLLAMSINVRSVWPGSLNVARSNAAFLATTALSNQSYVAYLSPDSVQHNAFTASILKWTNASSVPSSIGSFELLHTNKLLH